ncbi:ABC transporter permease [Cytobacillus depressus]|uniref:Nickel import system permease protein NikB n=1 Tax=Cytobacillus depressus TaxID=1602942 RepID=A0A6L3V315_9BACI|nr:nickel ABC transporter permease [Cytobacillus depressus]KAB2333316.1 ABC transporter permease [Cytobacillus depressus]
MLSYIVKRLLQLIPTLIGVTLFAFLLVAAVPGDPAQIIAGDSASEEEVQIIRDQLGIDKPLFEQYTSYVGNIVKGDLGTSLRSSKPVLDEIFSRFPTTVLLTFLSLTVMIIVGLIAGIASATKPNSVRDNVSMMFSLFGISMPVFWMGIMFILVFSYYLPWFPSGGSSEFKHFVLPSLVLGLSASGILARLTRSSILEIVNQDFVRTARAKGVKEKYVIYKHTLKNALIPIITIVGMEFGVLLGGTVITETVFSMNGIGRYVVESIQFRDFPAIQGSILFISTIFVLVILLVDLSYSIVDPRIRYDN